MFQLKHQQRKERNAAEDPVWDGFLTYFFDLKSIQFSIGDYAGPEIMLRVTLQPLPPLVPKPC